jgi:hypothetical protein
LACAKDIPAIRSQSKTVKAEYILKYKTEDGVPDHQVLVDVSCPTELMNLAYAALQKTQNNPDLLPAQLVNFNYIGEEK